MKKSKRLEFELNEVRDIAMVAASKGMDSKNWMQQTIIAAALMGMVNISKKKSNGK